MSRSEADLVGRARRRLVGHPESRDVSAPPLGRMTVKVLALEGPRRPDDDDAVWTLIRGPERGWLILDGLAALRTVAMVLGLPGPRIARPLGTVERGIVTAALASIVRVLAPGTELRLQPGLWRPQGCVRVEIAVHSQIARETVRLDVPPHWLPAPARADLAGALARANVEIRLPIELARTRLRANAYVTARRSDVVVFEGRAALSRASDWPVTLTCGRHAAPGGIAPSGAVTLTGTFAPATDVAATWTYAPGTESKPMTEDETGQLNATLAQAPIEVIAELGRFVVRADELVAMGPGSVLPLGSPRPSVVDLRVGDRSWARGELVDVDGSLGVRITWVAGGDAPPVHATDDEPTR